ncbi:hypothetical protein FZU01_22710 [Salmonella enterica subsp. enterica]|nr:hypothetical protein [Salmonella enterica subsp. enterica serovar Kintambo]ECV5098635.1 hypothetical protein [Salmonella enterica subsp. enterica serovar Kintambo]
MFLRKIAKISNEKNGNIVGRIGGNIPQVLLERSGDLDGYNFYISFQNPDDRHEHISIFVPNDYDEMLKGNIYPDCTVKVFSHSISTESDSDSYTLRSISKSFIVGYEVVSQDETDFITFSEYPNLIQDEEYYFKDLKRDGYSFFAQVDEDYYPDSLNVENYIFGYGALYLYKNLTTGNIIAGFWQFS